MLLSYSFAQNNINQNIITILGTTNVHGEIDPCGWKKKPLGGLARKATIIDEVRSEINGEPIVVDAGNLFFKKNNYEGDIFLTLRYDIFKFIHLNQNILTC